MQVLTPGPDRTTIGGLDFRVRFKQLVNDYAAGQALT